MKLQNMTIVFVIVLVPIILLMSYYIGLQIDTITMQNSYNTKLQEASRDAIEALEINTVEWNITSATSVNAKRRDIKGSINTFATSLANSLGIGGANLERIQDYIPVILYTMYDGYYLYSPEGKNGQKMLRPYSPYSARYVQGDDTDVTINYTLDNYIRVYGKVNRNYKSNEGYLVVCDSDKGVNGINNRSINTGTEYSGRIISELTYVGKKIEPEILEEQVCIGKDTELPFGTLDSSDTYSVGTYQYVYDRFNQKVYWDSDENNFFKMSGYKQQYLENYDDTDFLNNTFKKITIPVWNEADKEWIDIKIFQALNPEPDPLIPGKFKEDRDNFFEDIDGDENLKKISSGTIWEKILNDCGYDDLANAYLTKDFSSINYCVESYVFTKWVNNYLGGEKPGIYPLTVGDLQVSTDGNVKSLSGFTLEEQKNAFGQYTNVELGKKIFLINDSNNPDPEAKSAYQSSPLAIHKKDVIINKLEKNLGRAVEVANQSYDYRLPKLTYSEWEQALSNISIVTFMQGMQIGLKYYNNYAIATSTLNREYVDPQELYFSGSGDEYYHQRTCEKADKSNYVGYRSVDYLAKNYKYTDISTGEKITKYYYLHDDSGNSELECYSCLVNVSTYKHRDDSESNYYDLEKSYYNALARERYIQLNTPTTASKVFKITLDKKVYNQAGDNISNDNTKPVSPGETIKYEITVTNNDSLDAEIYMIDWLPLDYTNTCKVMDINVDNDVIKKNITDSTEDTITLDSISSSVSDSYESRKRNSF